MKEQVSSCCYESVCHCDYPGGSSKVFCNCCKRECNVKEKVSIDEFTGIIKCEEHGLSRYACDCFMNDYKRLKRLDENVKKEIKKYQNEEKYNPDPYGRFSLVLQVLESLYNETPQAD